MFGQTEQKEDSSSTTPVTYIIAPVPNYKGGIKQFYKDLNKVVGFGKDVNGSIWIKTQIDVNGRLTVLGVENGISTEIDDILVKGITELQNWSLPENFDKKISSRYPIRLVIEKGKIK